MADPVPLPDPAPIPAPNPPPTFLTGLFAWADRWLPTKWRSLLVTTVIALISSLFTYLGLIPKPLIIPVEAEPVPYVGEMGWHEPTAAEKAAALATPGVFKFEETEAGLNPNIFGDDDGNAFLWKITFKARGGQHVPTLNQGGVGSCVGHGWATGVNYVVAIQAALKTGPPQDPMVTIAPEVIYGGSRVNARPGQMPMIGDGSNGSWAATFVSKFGVVSRGKYGSYDVSSYDESNCRILGRKGIQGELLEACKKNPVGTTALVTNADDAEKAIKQGYPISVCSNVGFAGQRSRDSDGFLKQSWQDWAHCMCFIGYRADKKAFYCMNSWGPTWVGGPTGPGEPPPGGFWIDRPTADKMLRQGDSYAISKAQGFPALNIQPDDWIVNNDRRPARRLRGDFLALNFGGFDNALAP